MKTAITITGIIVMVVYFGLNKATSQWNTSGNDIYNTNSGNVGIGTNLPGSLLYVGKSMTEPTITIRNPGGSGGATFLMIDDASGANWKFKATLSGGFKIRDNANGLDVVVIEPNSFANAICIKNTGSIGIGTAMPDNSALVDMTSTTKGFQLPCLTQAQISSISNPANGLIVFCISDEKYYIYISNSSAWKEVLYGTGVITPPFTSCGDAITIGHVAGNVAPVTKTVTYGTVSGIPGEASKCWITRNLGASQQAISVSDATEASAGWYWQFNRKQGYEVFGAGYGPIPAWTISYIDENSDWLSINDPCAIELGGGWRITTYSELYNVDAIGGWTNWNGPWNSALKMHAAGMLDQIGYLSWRGTEGYYVVSEQNNNTQRSVLLLGASSCYLLSADKVFGFSVRCIQ